MSALPRALVLASDAFGGHGGIANYNKDALTSLCEYPGFESVTAVVRSCPGEPGQLPEKLDYVVDGLRGKLNYILTALKATRRRGPWQVVICAHINLLPVAYLLRPWLGGAPVVLGVYGIDVWQPSPSRLANSYAAKVNAFYSISTTTKDRFLGWAQVPPERGYILPNAIDLSAYSPGPKNEALLERYNLSGKTVIMTLARLEASERYKGVDEVLEVLPGLLEKEPGLRYLVAGDGSDRPRLEEKAQGLGLGDRVVFAGRISEEEKVDHYRLAEAYVMPSSGEGFGFVFLEALACGIPVVASTVDGSREAVRDGMLGIMVDPADPKAIESGILSALRQPKGVIPEGLDYFSYGNFRDRFHRMLDEVIDGGGR